MEKPKYNYGDYVRFEYLVNDGEVLNKCGVIEIVDRFGTFFNPNEVSYDIFVKKEDMLYKHISELYVKEKLRNARDDERIWKEVP